MIELKPITIASILIITVGGIYFYAQRNTSPSRTEEPITLQESKPTNIPEPSPSRPLKEGERFVGSMGIYVTIPVGMRFRQDPVNEMANNFYIESGPENKPTYQLYVINQIGNVSDKGLEPIKAEMDPKTIKEASVGGYNGIEGLIVGPRSRYNIYIIRDGKPVSFSTIPYTEENKAITDEILSTVSFE